MKYLWIFIFINIFHLQACEIRLEKNIFLINSEKTKEFIQTFSCSQNTKAKLAELLQHSSGNIQWDLYKDQFEEEIIITPNESQIYSLDSELGKLFSLRAEQKIIDYQLGQEFLVFLVKDENRDKFLTKINQKGFILDYFGKKYSGQIKIGKNIPVWVLQEDVEFSSQFNEKSVKLQHLFIDEKELHLYSYPQIKLLHYYKYNKNMKKFDPLSVQDLTAINLIHPGDRVKIKLEYKKISIETMAISRSMGKIHETIKLFNEKNQQEMYAKVIGEKLAHIQMNSINEGIL